jgi:hypothetical protein
MRNHFLSGPPLPSRVDDGDGEERLPYSSLDLPAWQIDLIDRFPLLFRCPEVGRDDYCHLRNGFDCAEEWEPTIRDMSAMAEALVRALRSSVQPEARIAIAEVYEEDGMLRWRINTNLTQPFLGFLQDYF